MNSLGELLKVSKIKPQISVHPFRVSLKYSLSEIHRNYTMDEAQNNLKSAWLSDRRTDLKLKQRIYAIIGCEADALGFSAPDFTGAVFASGEILQKKYKLKGAWLGS